MVTPPTSVGSMVNVTPRDFSFSYSAWISRNAKERRRNALVKYPLLICLRHRVVVRFKQKLCPVRIIGRYDGKPLELPYGDVMLFHKAEGFRIELQSFVLIAHEYAGVCNTHIWPLFQSSG